MIPSIIHQIWLGEKQPPEMLMNTWKAKHPDFEYKIWDDHLVLNTFWKNNDLLKSFLDKKIYHGAADVIRYEILFHQGGFVAPADSECLQSIEPLLSESNCFACYENEEVRKGLVSPHLGCVPRHKLMAELMKRLSTLEEPKGGWTVQDPWQVTGNKLLTKVIADGKFDIKIYPSYYFIPEHYTGIISDKEPRYAKHYWYTTKGGTI